MSNVLRWILRVLLGVLTVVSVVLILAAGFAYTWQAADDAKPKTTFEITATKLEQWAIGVYLRYTYGDKMNQPAAPDDDRPQVFIIESGETLTNVSQRLERQGLVSDADLFRRMVQYWGADADIQAGVFELRPNMTMEQIVRNLQHGRLPTVTVTIPEGWRAEQIAALLEQNGVVPADAFMQAVQNGVTGHPAVNDRPAGSSSSLEGFLFPDTYQFPLGAEPERVIEILLSTWETRVPIDIVQRAEASGRSVYDVMILASIVEREAVIANEQPLIAGVYVKRLAEGMYLQADPTVQYAKGYDAEHEDWWYPLTQEEYSSVSGPHNTYMNPGLPPTPICNPGLGAIEAALTPTNADYLFFVAKGDGSHVFAKTYEEHLANVAQYGGKTE